MWKNTPILCIASPLSGEPTGDLQMVANGENVISW